MRQMHLSAGLFKENKDAEEQNEPEDASEEISKVDETKKRPIVDVQTSIRYLKSKGDVNEQLYSTGAMHFTLKTFYVKMVHLQRGYFTPSTIVIPIFEFGEV